jgi:hypothetical protein
MYAAAPDDVPGNPGNSQAQVPGDHGSPYPRKESTSRQHELTGTKQRFLYGDIDSFDELHTI